MIFQYDIGMKLSKLFTKTRKEAPKDEVSKNAKLLIRAGYIHKEMAGVYSFLPLGLRVLNNVISIIREEMNVIGGQELLLSALQGPASWQKTERWDDRAVDSWFKTKLKNGSELGLGFTHEEPITLLMKNHIQSFRHLPVFAYQFQTKFRNETRAKSGIMRTREFIMKDLYSFSRDADEHGEFYEKTKIAYKNIFNRIGLGEKTFLTFASGGSFSKYSHEFQTVLESGEDIIHICESCRIAVNEEIIADGRVCPICGNKDLKKTNAVEVGNIFNLGTRFSDALGLTYRDETGKSQAVFMGSYGIGPARLMGAVVELLSDERGIVWPDSIAPYSVHLISLGKLGVGTPRADSLYKKLSDKGISVLYDDRELRAGEKFADADLIGIPIRVVVSDTENDSDMIEIKERQEKDSRKVKEEEFLSSVS